MNYLRTHYHAAIDIYKKMAQENRYTHAPLPFSLPPILFRNMLALNVYMAMCYHKLDFYDVSQEMLASYMSVHPDSVMANNLKACNNYRLYSGKAAEADLKALMDQTTHGFLFGRDIVKHNLVIFRGGEGALQVFPSLVDILPEARLNLSIYHLKQGRSMSLGNTSSFDAGNVDEGYELIKDLAPTSPMEYILKAVSLTLVGHEHNSVGCQIRQATTVIIIVYRSITSNWLNSTFK